MLRLAAKPAAASFSPGFHQQVSTLSRTMDRYSAICAEIALLLRTALGYVLLMGAVSLCASAMRPAVLYGPTGEIGLGVPPCAAHTRG